MRENDILESRNFGQARRRAPKRHRAAAKPRARPINNMTTGGVYDGADLRPFDGRPGALDALEMPSRMGKRLIYRDGRTEGVQS